jgi:hypothetical protein
VPAAPIDFDCCFENIKDAKFEQLPLQVPLVNVMSSMDDLRVASMKVENVENLMSKKERSIKTHM